MNIKDCFSKEDVLPWCTGDTYERTCQPAGDSSFPQSREQCSGSPPELPRDLITPHSTHFNVQLTELFFKTAANITSKY